MSENKPDNIEQSEQERKNFWIEWAKDKTAQEVGEKIAEKELDSETDALTGLRNRRGWDKNLEIFQKIHERGSTPISLLLIDVDDFKAKNDEWDHEAGDQVLIFVSQIIKDLSRKSDVPARIGGDEFASMLFDTDKKGAELFRQRIILEMKRALREMDDDDLLPQMGISISIGISEAEKDEILKIALKRADQDMYKVKRSSKNGQ